MKARPLFWVSMVFAVAFWAGNYLGRIEQKSVDDLKIQLLAMACGGTRT